MSNKTQRRQQTYKHPVYKVPTPKKPRMGFDEHGMWHNIDELLKNTQPTLEELEKAFDIMHITTSDGRKLKTVNAGETWEEE